MDDARAVMDAVGSERAAIEALWGTEDFIHRAWPKLDPSPMRWTAEMSRRAMSPDAALAYEEAIWEIDVRDVLSSIHVPTLIVHREKDSPEAHRAGGLGVVIGARVGALAQGGEVLVPRTGRTSSPGPASPSTTPANTS
jgi:pimeloyl-ACP methyl ester carboxylesterase